jgi:hypothetical protein
VPTRTLTQIRSYAQKYFKKVEKEMGGGMGGGMMGERVRPRTNADGSHLRMASADIKVPKVRRHRSIW